MAKFAVGHAALAVERLSGSVTQRASFRDASLSVSAVLPGSGRAATLVVAVRRCVFGCYYGRGGGGGDGGVLGRRVGL